MQAVSENKPSCHIDIYFFLSVSSTQETADGKPEVECQEDITQIIKRAETEDDVIDCTDSDKTAQIQDGIAKTEAMFHLIETGQCQYQYRPNRCQEEPQHPGNGKGIESGMEIEMTPHLGCKQLDGGIESR